MKTIKLTCESCGANLDIENGIVFCPYCGAKLILDDENQTTTYNYNHTYTKRDEARIKENDTKERIRMQELALEEKQGKRATKIGLLCGLGIPVFIILAVLLGFGINKCVAQAQGKISAGYHEDYIGEDYEAVAKQFEEMGFENIVTIDLNDSGIAFWNEGKVKSVSIDGNDSFENSSYFYPDAKVIIKYH